jgi:hypothetical protein
MLVLAFSAQRAWAFLDPPYITPANPTAGDSISVSIYGGECDVADDGVVWPPPVTQEGNAIEILLSGIHEGDPEWCYFGIGTVSYSIGSYSSGTYTLDVERRYMTVFGTWTQETLGVIPFTVAGAPPKAPIEAPASSNTSLAALLAALIGIAWFGLSQHRQQSR